MAQPLVGCGAACGAPCGARRPRSIVSVQLMPLPRMPSVMRGVRRMVMCAPGTPSVSDTPDLLKLTPPNGVLMRFEIGDP